MNVDKSAAKRYAEAVFNIARERASLDALRADIALMRQVFAKAAGHQLQTFIESPVHLTKTKEEVLEKAFGDQVSRVLMNVTIMLIRRGRMANLPLVLEHTDHLIDEEHGLITGTVTTAVELDAATRDNLLAALRKKIGDGLELQFLVKPEILGGTVVRYRDTLIDDSLQTKLRHLAERLSSPSIQRELVA